MTNVDGEYFSDFYTHAYLEPFIFLRKHKKKHKPMDKINHTSLNLQLQYKILWNS